MSPIDNDWDDHELSIYNKGRADAHEDKPKGLKRSEVIKMSAREAADRKPEIDRALREGWAPEEDGE